jgi:hypothetical protein
MLPSAEERNVMYRRTGEWRQPPVEVSHRRLTHCQPAAYGEGTTYGTTTGFTYGNILGSLPGATVPKTCRQQMSLFFPINLNNNLCCFVSNHSL